MHPLSRVPRLATPATLLLLILPSCTDQTTVSESPARPPYTTPTGLLAVNPPAIVAGAGDISTCGNNNDEATAKLLDVIPGTVITMGDNVMPNGTTAEFASCYDPTWGRHKTRTRPSAGNHDYNTSGAAGYFGYFGAAAGEPGKGYYSYELGAWHVIVLNSNISSAVGSAQDTWLKADLAAHPNQCILSYYHHPLYSSTSGTGTGGAVYSGVRNLFTDLYAGHADLVLNGHRHIYERIAPMKPDGTADPVNGVREIISGTGGDGGGTLTNIFPLSEVREGRTFGVLKLYLYDDSYTWKFVPVAGKTFTDSGSTACHSSSGGGGGVVSATNSAVSASPGSFTAGSGSSTITVTAMDGNKATISGASVTLAAKGSGTFTPASGSTNADGVFTSAFTSTVAETKMVSAAISGVAITQQASVTVTPATASALAFTTQPSNAQTGAPIAPAVVVEVQDQFGNRVNSSANVTMAIGTNAGPGATLSGTLTQAAANGDATFSDLSIDKTGTGYTLSASSAGGASATSNTFNITPPAPSATLSTVTASSPTFAAGGSAGITVTVKDGLGHRLSNVAVTLSSSVAGDAVTQPAATDVNGVTSGNVSATSAGPRTITAVAGGVTLSQKPGLTVTASTADASASTVSASPTGITAGSGSATITVTVRDQYGNRVSGSSVSLATSGTNFTLTQPDELTGSNGVATGSLSSTDPQTFIVSATADGVGITQAASVTVTNQPPPGITHTLLTSGANPTNLNTYTTASIAPRANTLITVAVLNHRTPAAISPTLSGGGMTTWTLVASVDFDTIGGALRRLSIFRAMSPSPSSGPITIKFTNSVSNVEWIVSQWDGVDISGVNGSAAIVQTGSNATNGSNGLAVTLAPLGNAYDVAYGAFGVNKNVLAITPGAGYTKIDEKPSGENTPGDLLTEWAVNLAIVNATWSNLRGGALGIEIKAATGP